MVILLHLLTGCVVIYDAYRINIVDPSGNVIPGNIVPAYNGGGYTDPPSNVVPGQADLNGRICGITNGSNIMYYFQYTTDCTFSSGISQTPSNNITASGSCNQTVAPQTVSNLAPGDYCYR